MIRSHSGYVFAAMFSLLLSGNLQANTITVDTANDGAASTTLCQLRDAIVAANTDTAQDGCAAGNGPDVIQFSISNAAILLESDLPAITKDLEINGPGRDLLIIDGDDAYRPIFVGFNVDSFTLRKLTLFQGYDPETAGCLFVGAAESILIEDVSIDTCASDSDAGGLEMSAPEPGSMMTLRRVIVNANRAPLSAGGANLTATSGLVEDSLFSNNQTLDPSGVGGGLIVGGVGNMTIRRTTFSGNTSQVSGAAVAVANPATSVSIEHSTLIRNSMTGENSFDAGGTISSFGQVTLFNTIVANNLELNPNATTGDISLLSGGSVVSSGFNFIGDNTSVDAIFPAGLNGMNDQAGTNASPLDAELGPVQQNGGSTLTALPDSDSPVVDQGSCSGQPADQRGYQNETTMMRPVNVGNIADAADGCDIGAVEYLAVRFPLFDDGFEE